MCTLIVARDVFPGFPIVIAANRDEALDRPSEPPRMYNERWRILAPRDCVRGGTWLGVNGFGVFAGLTNRADIPSQWGRMSRGTIVFRALRHYSASEAFIDLQSLRKSSLNGFHMVIADHKNAFLLKSDGQQFSYAAVDAPIIIATNQDVSVDGPPHSKRISEIMACWQKRKISEELPTPANLTCLLDLHGITQKDGTCIHEPEKNYGTKSSAIIVLQEDTNRNEWLYWHRERASRARHICHEMFQPKIILATRNS